MNLDLLIFDIFLSKEKIGPAVYNPKHSKACSHIMTPTKSYS